MEITVIIAVIVAIVLRVIVQKGNFILPKVYREGDNVRFNWGSVGVIVVAIIAVFGTGYFDPNIYTTPVTAFFAAYTLPAVSDAIATYALPGSDNDNIITPKSENTIIEDAEEENIEDGV